nr:MAG TPA: hypothetical protein [Caudoviricetes sp.]
MVEEIVKIGLQFNGNSWFHLVSYWFSYKYTNNKRYLNHYKAISTHTFRLLHLLHFLQIHFTFVNQALNKFSSMKNLQKIRLQSVVL